jgi:hypothetical protein
MPIRSALKVENYTNRHPLPFLKKGEGMNFWEALIFALRAWKSQDFHVILRGGKDNLLAKYPR